MFTFLLPAVRAIIARGETDAAVNGDFLNPDRSLADDRDQRPGLWLVGNEGVFLMSNGRPAEGETSLICYSARDTELRRALPHASSAAKGLRGPVLATFRPASAAMSGTQRLGRDPGSMPFKGSRHLPWHRRQTKTP